jgi:uncharacterized protein (DUF2236 family)
MAGYLHSDSMLRRVIGERVVALSGPRALLMMAAHPVAFAGFFAHTGSLDEPYARLRRTGELLDLIAWGDERGPADRATARVRAIHRQVRGQTSEAAGRFPAGTPYRADDPDLLLWILACMADSALLVYERYVQRLSDAAKDAAWADYRVVGRLFGLPERHMPARWGDLREYVQGMLVSGDLVVTPQARELALKIVMRPPAPWAARPVIELLNQVTVGLLPDDLRRQYGLRWDPIRGLLLLGGAHYGRRVLGLAPDRMRYVSQARSHRALRDPAVRYPAFGVRSSSPVGDLVQRLLPAPR